MIIGDLRGRKRSTGEDHIGAHDGGAGLVGDDPGDLTRRRNLALQGQRQSEAKSAGQEAAKGQQRRSE
jgi:hypothetical protein